MEAKLPINGAREWTPHLVRRMRRLLEEEKSRYNLAIYTIHTFTILSQQNKRDIETFQLNSVFTNDLQ